jgi:hypothetical protein
MLNFRIRVIVGDCVFVELVVVQGAPVVVLNKSPSGQDVMTGGVVGNKVVPINIGITDEPEDE